VILQKLKKREMDVAAFFFLILETLSNPFINFHRNTLRVSGSATGFLHTPRIRFYDASYISCKPEAVL
jgi:hypothetical protein